MRLLVLSIALTPYLGFIAIDAWMHEKARCVPRIEQCLHGGIALAVGTFFVLAFLGANIAAGVLLLLSLPLMAVDEIGFHGHLSKRDRLVHLAEGLSLILFVTVWLWMNYRL
jgi:hypothetical protein